MREDNHSGAATYDGLTLRIERLYQRVLQLHTAPEIELALAEVLRLLVEIMSSEFAYVEVFGTADTALYWLAHTEDAEAAAVVRARVSRDLVRLAIMKRKPVQLTLPAEGPLRPERTNALCTPLGGSVPIGILYVESTTWIATEDRERIETIAHHLGNIHTTVASPTQAPLHAQLRALKTRLVCDAMERHRGNISEVARELGVARTFVYRTLEQLGKPE